MCLIRADYTRNVAPIIRDWLRQVVEKSSLNRPVEYSEATLGDHTKMIFYPRLRPQNTLNDDQILLRPTTPLFFSSLAAAPNTLEFVRSCLQNADPAQSIIHTNEPLLLQQHLKAECNTPTKHIRCEGSDVPRIWIRLRWLPIKILRGWRISDVDAFAMRTENNSVDQYRRATVKLLFAKRLAFGFVEIIDLALWLLRIWLLLISITTVLGMLKGALDTEADQNLFWAVSKASAIHVYWLLGELL